MNVLCSATACPVLLSTTCVFYEGENLIYTGINTNDSVQEALQKIDEAFSNNILSINAILPISITSGPNPTISISQASATSNGYISSVDWNIFNNKVPSTRTLTINGTTYDLSANRSWTIPSDNIYNSDGTLTGNRTVSSGGFSLTLNPNTNLAGNLFGNTLRTRNSFSGSYTQPATVFSNASETFDGLTFTGNTLYMGQSNVEVTGGSSVVQSQGIDIEQNIKLSGASSRISAQNYLIQYRGYAGDISTNANNFMAGLYVITGHAKFDTTTNIVTGNAYGYRSLINNYGGTITNAYGYDSNFQSSTFTTAKNSTITNYYAFRSTSAIGTSSGPTATITNYYGLFLNTPTVNTTGTITNRWGLYAPDVAMNHYINGTFLIGTTTPSTFKLDVNGTARVSGALKLFSGGTAPANNYPLNAYVSSGGIASFEYGTDGFIQFVRAGASAAIIRSSYAETYDLVINAGNSGTFLGMCLRPDGIGVKIGGDPTTITHVNSAQLNVESTTKGFLQPRLTTVQRDAIASPATGLQVYNSTTNTNDYYNGTSWLSEGNVSGSGVAGQVAYWNGTSSQTGSNNLFWDAANARLGIGTNAPTANLSVVKNINGDNAFYVLNNSNGTSARNLFLFGEASSGGTYGTLQYINSGYSSSGLVTANTTILSGHATGGVTIAAFDATGTIKFGAGNSSSALMTLTATGALRFNSPSGSNNTYLEGVNSSGTLVSRISEASTVGSGGLYFQGARVDATSGGAMLFAGYVGSSGNTSAFEFRGVGGTISTIADLPSAIPIAIFSKRSGGATVNQMMLFQTGNLLIQNGGTFTDGGQRLQVQGDAFIKGSGATDATIALQVQNSSSTNLLRVRNDSVLLTPHIIYVGQNTTNTLIYAFDGNANTSPSASGRNFGIFNSNTTQTGDQSHFALVGNSLSPTSGDTNGVLFQRTFAPTSGTATFKAFNINPTINQTGGANGITRGLYVNPTLTAAADWRSIEWSNNSGWGLYGAGTANNYLNGRLGIGNTNPTYILDILVNANNAQLASFKNSSAGIDAFGGFVATNNNNQTGGFAVYSSAFSNTIFANNLALVHNRSIVIGTDSNVASGGTSKISFQTGGYSVTPQMTLTSAGRLLLGTTSEDIFLLDVNGAARLGNTNYYATLTNGGSEGGILRVGGPSYGQIELKSYAITLNGGHFIYGTGGTAEFGITSQVSPAGANSGGRSAMMFTADNPGSGGGIWPAYPNAAAFHFRKKELDGTYTSLLVMNGSSNNIGIGTTTPASSYKLDVVGAIRASTYLFSPALYAPTDLFFGISGGTSAMRITTNRNVQIFDGATPADNGNRLQVTGTSFLNGNSTVQGSFVVQSSSTNFTIISNPTNAAKLFQLYWGGSVTYGLDIQTNLTTQLSVGNGFGVRINNLFAAQYTTGAYSELSVGTVFNPSSGTGTYTNLRLGSAVSQSGGANGITRGILIDPTLSSAADWRSIEWSNNTGWGLYGAGTALNYLGGTLGIKTTSPYAPSTFSLDVNGGLLVKNTAGTTAQITLINADPSIGGNNGFLVASVGGTSGGSYVDLQGYYGTSIVGSTALRLNPAGGAVIVNSTTNSGEQFQVTGDARITGTIYQDGAADALFNFQNAGANKWRIGNAFVSGSNYFQLYDSVSNLERIRWNNNSTATFTSDITFIGGSNAVATFQSTQPDVKIQASGASNAVSLSLVPSNGFEGVIQNNVTNGFIQVKTASTTRVTFKNGGQVNFQPLAADPAGAGAGDVYYNSGTNKLRLYDGTSWVDLN